MSWSNSDRLANLPVSQNAPYSQHDLNLTSHLFGSVDAVNTKAVSNSLKMPVFVALLVGVMLHPMSNEIVRKIYPKAEENTYTMIAVKMAISALLYFLMNHWSKR